MTITSQNASVRRGDSATLSVTLTMANGAPFDPLLATAVKYRISRNWHTPEEDALVRKEMGQGITSIGGGVVAVDLLENETDLPPGLYYHELKVLETGSSRSTTMVGTFIVKKSLRMQFELLAIGVHTSSPRFT